MGRLHLALAFAVFWLTCGCVHGPFPGLAYPPTGSDEPASEPSPEPSSDDVPSVVRTALVARATREDVWRVACALRPTLAVAGRSRPLDLQVDAKPCTTAPSPDGIRANVDGVRGVLELEVPQGTTTAEVRELQQGLADVSAELARRLAAVPPKRADEPAPIKKPGPRSARWLIATAVLGGSGLIMLAIGGAMAASGDRGLRSSGEAVMLSIALPLGVATTVVGVTALIMRAGEE